MRVVIIGNGVAGNSAVSAIREVDKNIEITMISEEIFPEYSACVLPDYLAGEIKRESVFLKSLDDYLKDNIEVIFGGFNKHSNISNTFPPSITFSG